MAAFRQLARSDRRGFRSPDPASRHAAELGYSETILLGLPAPAHHPPMLAIQDLAVRGGCAGRRPCGLRRRTDAVRRLRYGGSAQRDVPTPRWARSASISRSKSSAEENDR